MTWVGPWADPVLTSYGKQTNTCTKSEQNEAVALEIRARAKGRHVTRKERLKEQERTDWRQEAWHRLKGALGSKRQRVCPQHSWLTDWRKEQAA